MKTYISILRGVNVSGQKKIKMADLKSMYEGLGFQNVVTYIQSGNIIFDTKLESVSDIQAQISDAIESKYQFHVPVQLRTSQDFSRILESCPFQPIDLALDGSKVIVTFLSSQPAVADVALLESKVIPPERLAVIGREVYLHCPNGYGKTKLSNTTLERILGISATSRNWKSVIKIFELSSSN